MVSFVIFQHSVRERKVALRLSAPSNLRNFMPIHAGSITRMSCESTVPGHPAHADTYRHPIPYGDAIRQNPLLDEQHKAETPCLRVVNVNRPTDRAVRARLGSLRANIVQHRRGFEDVVLSRWNLSNTMAQYFGQNR